MNSFLCMGPPLPSSSDTSFPDRRWHRSNDARSRIVSIAYRERTGQHVYQDNMFIRILSL